MRRLIVLLLVFLFVLGLVGCTEKNVEQLSSNLADTGPIVEETVNQEETTISTSAPEAQTDYTGDAPTEAELSYYFHAYAYETVKARMSQDEVHYCGHTDNYAIVLLSGMGPKIMLYEFTYSDGCIQVLSKAPGSIALSGGLSINHIERDGQHFYFGSCSDYHWDSIKETRLPIAWQELRIFGENNEIATIAMPGKLGYLCILDTPMTDFQVVEQAGNICLDYAAYFEQKYLMDETEFYSPEE